MDLKLEEKIRHECKVERVDASRSDPLAYSYAMTRLSMLSRRLSWQDRTKGGKGRISSPTFPQARLTFPGLTTIPGDHVTIVCQCRLFRLSSNQNHLLLLLFLLLLSAETGTALNPFRSLPYI
jgi:hypothetical protein